MKNKYYTPSPGMQEKRELQKLKKKTCSKCRVTKDHSEFTKDVSSRDGIAYWCKTCKNESIRTFRKENPVHFAAVMKRNQMKTKYGIHYSVYEQMLAEQNYLCAICKTQLLNDKNTHVDHDHLSGQIRKILCGPCNKGLGFFRESPDILRSAAEYLDFIK